MPVVLNADILTVAVMELVLLGSVVYALVRDGKLPLSRWLQQLRTRCRPRSKLTQPMASTHDDPPTARAVAEASLEATPRIKRGKLTMGLVTGTGDGAA